MPDRVANLPQHILYSLPPSPHPDCGAQHILQELRYTIGCVIYAYGGQAAQQYCTQRQESIRQFSYQEYNAGQSRPASTALFGDAVCRAIYAALTFIASQRMRP